MRELHWGATPVSSRTFAPVATPEPANPGDEVDDAWWAGTLETKLTMPGGDGGGGEDGGREGGGGDGGGDGEPGAKRTGPLRGELTRPYRRRRRSRQWLTHLGVVV